MQVSVGREKRPGEPKSYDCPTRAPTRWAILSVFPTKGRGIGESFRTLDHGVRTSDGLHGSGVARAKTSKERFGSAVINTSHGVSMASAESGERADSERVIASRTSPAMRH